MKIIAYYLPQYHPFKENNEWWGKGFTEWTNVAKAKKMFPGHYQPKVPTELGFYDLRMASVRSEQAELAKKYGIYGFCYWHYWFGNGKRLMETVFDQVLESHSPNFPFCLAWANHSWYAKRWNRNGTKKDRLLMEQTYPGDEDIEMHFKYLLKAFKDPRYIKIDGAPMFTIFEPSTMPIQYIQRLQELAKENGFEKGLFIVGNITKRETTKEYLLSNGYSAVTYQRLTSKVSNQFVNRLSDKIRGQLFRLLRLPIVTNYKSAIKWLINPRVDSEIDVIPTVVPNWDHTPRSGRKGTMFFNATPENFYKLLKKAFAVVRKKPDEYKILFLKSWNEWGEGNYVEPDLKYGTGYLEAVKRALDEESEE